MAPWWQVRGLETEKDLRTSVTASDLNAWEQHENSQPCKMVNNMKIMKEFTSCHISLSFGQSFNLEICWVNVFWIWEKEIFHMKLVIVLVASSNQKKQKHMVSTASDDSIRLKFKLCQWWTWICEPINSTDMVENHRKVTSQTVISSCFDLKNCQVHDAFAAFHDGQACFFVVSGANRKLSCLRFI